MSREEIEELAENAIVGYYGTKYENMRLLGSEKESAYGFKQGFIEGYEQAQPKWLDPEDQLPVNDQKILFETINGNIRNGVFLAIDSFDRPNMFYGQMGYFNIADVRLWTVLPTPPQEK